MDFIAICTLLTAMVIHYGFDDFLDIFPELSYVFWGLMLVCACCVIMEECIQASKPVKIVRVKVLRIRKYWSAGGDNIVIFRFPDKKKYRFWISDIDRQPIKKGDIVKLKYQGCYVKDIKKVPNE